MALLKRERKYLANDILHLPTQVVAVGAFLIGLSVAFGGAARWSTETYFYLSLIPGGPQIFGIAVMLMALLVGLAYLLDAPMFMDIILKSIAGWFFIFALGIGAAAILIPTVSFTGLFAFSFIAATYIVVAKLWKVYGDPLGKSRDSVL